MTSRDALIAPHVQAFFAQHLAQHKRVSPQTMVSYRDTFRLLLTFIKETTGRNLDPACRRPRRAPRPAISRLSRTPTWQCHPLTNMRLAAIRSFARFLALRDPEHLAIVTHILAIPSKRADKKLIGYLTRAEVEALLAAPDRAC